jgi:hypothetical protein
MDSRVDNVTSWFHRIYLGGIPQMIRDETAFLSFLCMMTAIDALAGYWDPDRSGQGSIGARFRDFVKAYFPADYHSHADDLWDFRNGMAHGFSPRKFALTHHNGSLHFRATEDGAKILNAEDVAADLLGAARKYFAELATSPDLQARFLKRIESNSGGAIGVGPIQVLPPATGGGPV